MTEQPMAAAAQICAELLRRLQSGALDGSVHTVFDHAVNIETAEGLCSVLSGTRCPMPYAVRLSDSIPFPARGWKAGARVRVTKEAIRPEGGEPVDLAGAAPVELSVYKAVGRTRISRSLSLPQELIDEIGGGEADGLSILVTGGTPNVYAAFLAPRLPALYDAVRRFDAEGAAEAAARIAGCGMGLTPSSDDLLCGYMAALHALSAAGRFPEVLHITRRMASSAAAKTNRISGAFLWQSGEGLVSGDVLALLQLLISQADGKATGAAAHRVAQFGSTSGRDLLTGIALAIIQHYGGKNSGQTGNQKECLL